MEINIKPASEVENTTAYALIMVRAAIFHNLRALEHTQLAPPKKDI